LKGKKRERKRKEDRPVALERKGVFKKSPVFFEIRKKERKLSAYQEMDMNIRGGKGKTFYLDFLEGEYKKIAPGKEERGKGTATPL